MPASGWETAFAILISQQWWVLRRSVQGWTHFVFHGTQDQGLTALHPPSIHRQLTAAGGGAHTHTYTHIHTHTRQLRVTVERDIFSCAIACKLPVPCR